MPANITDRTLEGRVELWKVVCWDNAYIKVNILCLFAEVGIYDFLVNNLFQKHLRQKFHVLDTYIMFK